MRGLIGRSMHLRQIGESTLQALSPLGVGCGNFKSLFFLFNGMKGQGNGVKLWQQCLKRKEERNNSHVF